MNAERTACVRRIAAGIDAALHPPTHDTRPPAERVRAPRDAPPPAPWVPPPHGSRDRDAARVIARWMVTADHKFRWRGIRARLAI